jgi:hypothetical protein
MSKVLAWSSLATSFLFAVFVATALLAWDAVGAGTAQYLLIGGIAMLVISVLLAIAILVVELVAGNSAAADAATPAAVPSSTAGSFSGFPGVEEAAEPSDDAGSSADAEPLSPTDTSDDDF